MEEDIRSEAGGEGAIHAFALGDEKDYRALARTKVLVDKHFAEVQNGKLRPDAAMRCIASEIRMTLTKY